MLQKEFFQVQPFNPRPYWDDIIVNLSGASKQDNDIIYGQGIYQVSIQSGGSYTTGGGKIETTIRVLQPFRIRAYCGEGWHHRAAGTGEAINPYNGIYKVNYMPRKTYAQAVPYVNHIFGNAASAVSDFSREYWQGAVGNCLGNGYNTGSAGCCLHFLPKIGSFGTNYLFAFHTTGAADSSQNYGTGSALGGAASSGGNSPNYTKTTADGGSTPYGSGGTGQTGTIFTGQDGTGIGHGRADGNGAAAWFNGSIWVDSSALSEPKSNGQIIVKYLGPLE